MNLIENVREGVKSISSNLLRTILTALIITIGITSLVGILTAIDSLRASVNDSLSSLGANVFEVKDKTSGRRNRRGRSEKTYPPIKYEEAVRFKEIFQESSEISISTFVTFNAEVKSGSNKTNPNIQVNGGDEYYLLLEGLNIAEGRNFSNLEVAYGTNVCIVGKEVADKLFPKASPIQQDISLLGNKFKVIGLLEEQSGVGDNSSDRSVIVPTLNATRLPFIGTQRFTTKVGLSIDEDIEAMMGEATGLMRSIRKDQIGKPESFLVARSQTLASATEDLAFYLRVGGAVIGFITLLGASIGLMNIMLVSVTERTREIGVRKALGATPRRIRQQFLIEAIVICLMGGFSGVILGTLVGNLVGLAIGEGGFVFPFLWIIVGLIVTIVVGMISGAYPAFKASKLDPIESLRFE